MLLVTVALLYWTCISAQTNPNFFGPPSKGHHESAEVYSVNIKESTIPYLKPPANPRVMYGSSIGQFYNAPWSVHIRLSLINGHENSCSGSLISPDLVLTCGHCVDSGKLSDWRVYSGIADGESSTNGTERSVKYYSIHPRFKNFLNPEASYDMAILSLTQSFVTEPGKLEAIGFPRLGVSEPAPISQPSLPVVDVIRPLDRWTQCQYRGSSKTFNNDGTKCIDGTTLRYSSGVLMESGCCEAVERAQNIEPSNLHPLGTICIYNYTDASCPGDSGSGITCKSSTDANPVLIGLMRAGKPCCNRDTNEKVNGPLPRNLVVMDYDHRLWISSVVNHYYSTAYRILPGEPMPTSAPKPGISDDEYWANQG